MLDTKRREVIIALLGAGGLLLAVKVRRTRAQQPAMPVISFVSSRSMVRRAMQPRSRKASAKPVTSRAKTWSLSTTGSAAKTIACPPS
jgi:hypothetical protein